MDQRHPILLVGASTYMAAVEAALQAEPGLIVRRMAAIPAEIGGYQAMLVDTRIALEEVQAAAAAHPGLPIFRLDWSKSRVIALLTEGHILEDTSGLAQIIQDRCQHFSPELPRRAAPKPAPGELPNLRKL